MDQLPSPPQIQDSEEDLSFEQVDLFYTVSQSHWSELSKLLGYNLESGTDLVRRVQQLATIKVEGIEIQLPPQLVQRIRNRAYHADQMQTLLQKLIPDLLNEEIG